MTSEEQLRTRLRKIEALFAGATTAGERVAAEAAHARIKDRLAEARRARFQTFLQYAASSSFKGATASGRSCRMFSRGTAIRSRRPCAREGLPIGVRAGGASRSSRTPLNTASRSRLFFVSVL
jgi:hypothetical protein